MARDGIRERDWRTLLWSIRQGSCILFLGNDVSIDYQGGKTTVQGELAEFLHEELEQSDLPADSLRDVAYAYQSENSRVELNHAVVEFLDEMESASSPTVTALARLPWRLVVDASFDDLFARTVRATGVIPSVEHYNFRGDAQELVAMPKGRAPLVYHLYGRASDPDSLVLTEDDMLEFLESVISSNPALPVNLSSEFRRSGVSFLFVGFGLKHPYLRMLLHVLRMNESDSKSYALENDQDTSAGGPGVPLLLKRGYRIRMLEQPVNEFCEELARRYEESEPEEEAAAAPAASAAGALPDAPDEESEAPKVFISYASEDEEHASWLHAALQAASFDAWFDKSELRGGDEWDDVIKRSVTKCDYFLVLQSRALANKQWSYVNREIRLALERQMFARSGIRFIVPLAIDDSPPLEEFLDIQSESLKTEDDLQRLITLLRRDQLRRQKVR